MMASNAEKDLTYGISPYYRISAIPIPDDPINSLEDLDPHFAFFRRSHLDRLERQRLAWRSARMRLCGLQPWATRRVQARAGKTSQTRKDRASDGGAGEGADETTRTRLPSDRSFAGDGLSDQLCLERAGRASVVRRELLAGEGGPRGVWVSTHFALC